MKYILENSGCSPILKGNCNFLILIFTAAAVNENLFNFDIKEHMPLTELMGDIKNFQCRYCKHECKRCVRF